MRGAIAAGHPLTAAAGARVLAEGGNAVDAAVAAGFASWVTEAPLTGPGGGGFMLIHRARDRSTRVLDFFVTVPAGGAHPEALTEIVVEFTREGSQVFYIGPASVAVPGTAAGLEASWRSFGSLPWPELVAPAIELARDGLEITAAQSYLHTILAAILGPPPHEGEHLRYPDFAATLERIAEEGAACLYRGDFARSLAQTAPQISTEGLAAYRVIRRRPVSAPFCGAVFTSNPPPSSGGVLIAYGLQLLERLPQMETPEIVHVMREQDAARDARFVAQLFRGGLARRLIASTDAPSMTTHISVVDGRGNAASLSCSLGSGSGVVVPGTGVWLNNMLGEADLAALHKPGERLTSMMAPSICFADGRPRLVAGSAGSARLRGAIMQVVVNVLAREQGVAAAVDRPRVHVEGDVVHAEGGADTRGVEDVNQWQERNLYFGGVNAVEVLADGSLAAAGDPRRGGAAVVVE